MRARTLRQGGNEAEALLWLELKNAVTRRISLYASTSDRSVLRRFCVSKQRLVVEIDGSQGHADSPRDRVRDEFMRAQGYSVLRFWNRRTFSSIVALSARPFSLRSMAV